MSWEGASREFRQVTDGAGAGDLGHKRIVVPGVRRLVRVRRGEVSGSRATDDVGIALLVDADPEPVFIPAAAEIRSRLDLSQRRQSG